MVGEYITLYNTLNTSRTRNLLTLDELRRVPLREVWSRFGSGDSFLCRTPSQVYCPQIGPEPVVSTPVWLSSGKREETRPDYVGRFGIWTWPFRATLLRARRVF